MQRSDPVNRPKWLSCKNALIPDMLSMDPLKMPVFEITGAEFTKSEAHTADGISIRFPRITKQRTDKSPNEATSLNELKHLFEASKDGHNLQMLTDGLDDDEIDIKTTLQGPSSSSPRKRKSDSVACEVAVKKSKTTHGDRVTADGNVRHKYDDMFAGICLYVCDDARALCTEELRYFQKWCGDETSNAKKCTHVLHKSTSTEVTLKNAR